MRRLLAAAAIAALVTGCASTPAPVAVAPDAPWIAAAVADADRPQTERDRDTLRKPAEVLAFAGISPGQEVLDIIPGTGYFTRLFAEAVGPTGKVYAYVPTELVGKFNSDGLAKGLAAAYPNVEYASDPLAQAAPGPIADVVFTAQNYHDFHTPYFEGSDIVAINRALYSVVRPGGALVIIDHVAQAGSGLRDVSTLHRIDPEAVKRELSAAGFVLEAESEILRNPADPRTANVFDPSIRGRTDQFMLRFRKPAR
ncbi:MAG TPA: methyltransferase [Caulobacteraceae bacterium]|jgi:predicted methyltransferase